MVELNLNLHQIENLVKKSVLMIRRDLSLKLILFFVYERVVRHLTVDFPLLFVESLAAQRNEINEKSSFFLLLLNIIELLIDNNYDEYDLVR